ncbi:MAG: M20/M25/M40 family metallo-hydrolase [Treponema sp.]|jgi:putative selenium metabolism hydrolase|nr:M20/M25/M40 family metallo-hydrolase [Treponema sp.]
MVDSLKQAYRDYLVDLIRFPSLTGQEEACARYVLDSLKALGVEAYIDAAGNVVGELRRGKGPAVLLNTHLDVVAPGNEDAWRPYTPFGGDVDGDLVIGRGASDIKGGLAAQFFAFKRFKEALDAGRSFEGTLLFSAVVHEEAAEMLGMRALIEETLPRRGQPVDLCIVGEPTGGLAALGQRGKVEIAVTTRGKTAHSSEPALGINALEKMIPVTRYVFEEMPLQFKAGTPQALNSVTITDCVVKPGRMSVIPDLCEISIDRRYMPGEELSALLAEFEGLFDRLRAADPDFKAAAVPRSYREKTWTGYEREVIKYHPPWNTDPDLPIVKKALAGLEKTGQNPQRLFWKFGTDGSMTAALHHIPTIGYSHGGIEWAHQPQERVSLTEMCKTVEGTFAMAAEVLKLT